MWVINNYPQCERLNNVGKINIKTRGKNVDYFNNSKWSREI